MTSDQKLTDALEAFCKRAVEGNEVNPTGLVWDQQDRVWQNAVRDKFLGPLHAAAQVLTAPRTVTTAEELDALPIGSVVLDSEAGDAWQKLDADPVAWFVIGSPVRWKGGGIVGYGPYTVLHEAER